MTQIIDPIIEQYAEQFKASIPLLTDDRNSEMFIDNKSRELCRWFRGNYDMLTDSHGQSTAYKSIFDELGHHPRWGKRLYSRCDRGKCSGGDFALRLIKNQEKIKFTKWWDRHGYRIFQKKFPGIPLMFEYNGVQEEPYVMFFPEDTSQPDFRVMNAVTEEILAYVEFKDDAIWGKATYKWLDLRGYRKRHLATGIPVYMVTFFYEKGSTKILYFSIIDHNGIEDLLSKKLADNKTIVKNCFAYVPWFALGERLCTVLGDEEYQNRTERGNLHQIRKFSQFGDMYDNQTSQLVDDKYNPKN
jgi:hypothetical protein